MEKHIVKQKVYNFVNDACKELDCYVVNMYDTNQFTLMDSDTETPNSYTLEELENELKEEGIFLSLDSEVKEEAVKHAYEYSDEEFVK